MQPQLVQSGLPPNWHGVIGFSKFARHARRRLGEDAVVRRVWRHREGVEHPLGRAQLRIRRAEVEQVGDDLLAVGLREALGRNLAHLRRVEAHPHLRHVGVRRPELHELLEVAVAAHLLPRHGAVDADAVPLDVLEDAVVGGGLPPLVVLGLQAVDRHHELQPAQARPTRSESAARRW